MREETIGLSAPALPAARAPAAGFRSMHSVYTLLLLTLMYVCLTIDRGIVSVLLGPIKAEFLLSDSQLGFLALSFSLTAVLASQAALPHLLAQPRGRIVNVGALASGQAGTGMGAYAAAKAGVSRLTEALAEELEDRRITVNAVLPSIIDTPANRAGMPDADVSRWVQPDQLAGVIAFLLSDAAAAVTGALIPVRGRA